MEKFRSFPGFFKFIIILFILSPFAVFFYESFPPLTRGIIFVLSTIFSWGLSYFLVMRKNWARIIIKVLSILESIYLLILGTGVVFLTIIGNFNIVLFFYSLLNLAAIAFNLAIFVYFSKKRIKALFGK